MLFKGSDVVPICRVPLITSQREEQALITANNMKPVVKLLINRLSIYVAIGPSMLLLALTCCYWHLTVSILL